MYPSLIQAPDQPLSGFRLLRTVVDNPIKAWPGAVYREDVYRSRRFGRDTVFVMAPALVRTVLLDDADHFEKGEVVRRALSPALGESILIADGARWRWQRRAVAPIFHQKTIRNFLPAMIACAQRARDRWLGFGPGSEIDVSHEMMQTTFDIILNTLLPGRSSLDVELIRRSITDCLEPTSWIIALGMIGAPRWVPHPGLYRARRARNHLPALILQYVRQ